MLGKGSRREKVRVKRSRGRRIISATAHSAGLTPFLRRPASYLLNVGTQRGAGDFYIVRSVMSFFSRPDRAQSPTFRVAALNWTRLREDGSLSRQLGETPGYFSAYFTVSSYSNRPMGVFPV